MKRYLVAVVAILVGLGAIESPAQQPSELRLIQMARSQPKSPAFRKMLLAEFGVEKLRDGSALISQGAKFLWAIDSQSEPHLYINDQPGPQMKKLPDSDLWILSEKVKTGRSHSYFYRIDGKRFGRRVDVPAYGPDSYPQLGVPQGEVSEQLVYTAKVFPNWQVSYWVYVSPGYDPHRGVALMVWQDGHRFVKRGVRSRLFTVTENLVHQRRIPPMIHVLVAPGTIGEVVDEPYVPDNLTTMRSVLYDKIDDDYVRFLLDELLPEVEKKYKIRSDGYSRGIAGQSSGGIAAFNAAWHRPDKFSRVLSRIGSFTAVQWRYGPTKYQEGGHIYPFLVRAQPRKNIRIWIEDGSEDLEHRFGSWPLQNIQLANSLKMKEYDFHFTFGNNAHNTAQGNAELPDALTWLWRDYDPALTEQIYKMDPEEKNKPYLRVKISNR